METHFWRRGFAAALLGLVSLLASGAAFADPPYRVARLSYATGNVSFSPGGEEEWSRAVVNRPLIDGDRLWVDASSRAELELGATRVRAGDGTSLSVLAVDDRLAQLELTQGVFEIRVWQLDRDQELEVDTPNLAVVIRQPGNYRVDVDPQDGSTGVTVRAGAATLYGEGRAMNLAPADTWRFYDTALADYDRYQPAPADDLTRFAASRDTRWQRSVSARYVSRDMIGFDDLDEYGTWRQVPDYGWVWSPARVASDWAPYRDGHWAWVEPWGWTWIDDAPWGFAPSHYGRWALVQQRWCWVPGPANVRPVYAPALVAFVGGSGLSVSVSGGGGVVGWFPLGPREVYRPAYATSRDYFTRVNVSNTVVNVTQVVNVYETHRVTNNYVNQRAVIAMPMQAFAQAKPVAREMVHVRAENVRPQAIVQAPPVAPDKRSVLGPQAAQHRPPEQALRKQVVAQTPPPPPRAPIESRLQQLREHPGQPVAPAATPAPRAPAPGAPAPAVKVVKPAQPSAAPPAPAPAAAANRAEREKRREQRGERPAGNAPAPAAAPAPAPGHTAAPAPASAPAPAARPAPAPAPAAASSPAERARADERARGDERQRERPAPNAPGHGVTAPAPVTPPSRPAPTAPAAQPAPPAPRPTPAARPQEAAPAAQQRDERIQQRQEQQQKQQQERQQQQQERQQQAQERQQQRQQEQQQRQEQRREAAPAAPHAPAPAAPAAPAQQAAPAAASHPAAPAPRAEQQRERASDAREQREQRREDRKQ
ncbi:MAG TPA: DUF6600 domain-containing protein [Ramlibacter sp.]